MDEQLAALREAFEDSGYDVSDVTRNRTQVRVVLQEEGANADDLREITSEVVASDDVLGLDVTTESVEGQDDMVTVVTFRYRSS